jgi:hypothetical protein
LTIRLRIDPATGKKDVLVDYESDADALPMEHEEAHRRLVDRLIEGGLLRAEEVGRVVVAREAPASEGSGAKDGDEASAAERAEPIPVKRDG